jgi:ABC-type lipoprotein release transport system permease subunit
VQSFLVGVSATDAITFTGVPLVLIVVAAVAAWVPARRASAIDPVVALREE